MACRDEGVGLAAPQVGVNVRLMVYNPEGEKGKGREWILVNPRLISSGKGTETMEEGCLSFQDASIDLYIRGDVSVSLCTQSVRLYRVGTFYCSVQQVMLSILISCAACFMARQVPCGLCAETKHGQDQGTR